MQYATAKDNAPVNFTDARKQTFNTARARCKGGAVSRVCDLGGCGDHIISVARIYTHAVREVAVQRKRRDATYWVYIGISANDDAVRCMLRSYNVWYMRVKCSQIISAQCVHSCAYYLYIYIRIWACKTWLKKNIIL